jgi:hypothetical protein
MATITTALTSTTMAIGLTIKNKAMGSMRSVEGRITVSGARIEHLAEAI